MTIRHWLGSAPAVAAFVLGASLLASSAAAAPWVVNKEQSTLRFEAIVFGSTVPGTFGVWEADINFDADALAASSVSVVIDMTSADTGDSTRDGSLKGDEWFATDEFPQSTLKSTAFRSMDDGSFEMDADLTMRGVTNRITLPFTLNEQADGVFAEGSVTVNRTNYGVGQGDFVTGSTVGLDVTISIAVAATSTPAN